MIIHELRLDFEIYQRINSNFEMKKISSFGFEKISWTSFEKKVQKLSNDEIYFFHRLIRPYRRIEKLLLPFMLNKWDWLWEQEYNFYYIRFSCNHSEAISLRILRIILICWLRNINFLGSHVELHRKRYNKWKLQAGVGIDFWI